MGVVDFVGGWIVGFESGGDAGAPAAFGVAGVEEDAVGWSGEDGGGGFDYRGHFVVTVEDWLAALCELVGLEKERQRR